MYLLGDVEAEDTDLYVVDNTASGYRMRTATIAERRDPNAYVFSHRSGQRVRPVADPAFDAAERDRALRARRRTYTDSTGQTVDISAQVAPLIAQDDLALKLAAERQGLPSYTNSQGSIMPTGLFGVYNVAYDTATRQGASAAEAQAAAVDTTTHIINYKPMPVVDTGPPPSSGTQSIIAQPPVLLEPDTAADPVIYTMTGAVEPTTVPPPIVAPVAAPRRTVQRTARRARPVINPTVAVEPYTQQQNPAEVIPVTPVEQLPTDAPPVVVEPDGTTRPLSRREERELAAEQARLDRQLMAQEQRAANAALGLPDLSALGGNNMLVLGGAALALLLLLRR